MPAVADAVALTVSVPDTLELFAGEAIETETVDGGGGVEDAGVAEDPPPPQPGFNMATTVIAAAPAILLVKGIHCLTAIFKVSQLVHSRSRMDERLRDATRH